MVDAVVSFVVQRLGDLLIEQVFFVQGVEDEVQWLRNELEYMLCFLKDAEEKQDEDHRIKKWISDIRDIAYDAEDIIDNFILEVVEGRTPKKMGLKGWFEKYLCICSKQVTLYGIGTEINSFKNRFEQIQRNQKRFKIGNIGDAREDLARGRLNQQRRERPYEDNELVVGFKNDVELLMSKLVNEDPHRHVVSIVGMGGLGKTTIARKLYNTSSLTEQFDFKAWVFVSKDYNIQDLLQRTIKSFKKLTTKEEFEILEMMKEEDLESSLRDILEGHRYLVVFDDVWDEKAWKSLRRALPDNKNGSRVIITTRQKVVAERLNERTYVHELQFLGEVESWELFCKKVLPNCNEVDDKNSCIPQDLESISREMVRKCHGLPLAIILLGGLLSKKSTDEWQKVQEHMWRHVRKDNPDVQHILALSFHDLPHHLKSCFLYLGLFPEDFEIDANKLYKLWVAEGFIKLDEESEEMAAEYLKELCDRSLLQVAEKKWRRIISCQIHDLLRDFAIEKSKELNFLQLFDGALVPNSRRLALHCGLQRFVSVDHSNLRLRTFHLFEEFVNESYEIDQLVLVCRKSRLLRVLNLWDLSLNSSQGREKNRLAEAIGKLIHLRYLGLDNTQIDDISPFIGNLQALQTLELESDYENPILLPDEICKAKQLRHLLGAFKWPFRVENLTNLRTLKFVMVEAQMEFDPMNLINLRELSVVIVGQSNRFTLDSIVRLRFLQSFDLVVRDDGSPWFPPLRPLSHCQHLIQLRLRNKRPQWKLPTELHEFLPNLKFLHITASGLMSEDPMPILEKLPQLTILELRLQRVNKLVCTTGGFPQLQFLHIYDIYVLRSVELQVEEGGMPLLKGLTVHGYVRIPERLRSIPAIPWGPRYNIWAY